MWVVSSDGESVDAVREELAASVLVDGSQLDEVELTPDNAAEFGWFEVVETEQPSPDHVAEIVAEGGRFVHRWRLDPDVRAARLRAEVAQVRSTRLVGRVAALRAIEDGNPTAAMRTLAGALADLIEERASQ